MTRHQAALGGIVLVVAVLVVFLNLLAINARPNRSTTPPVSPSAAVSASEPPPTPSASASAPEAAQAPPREMRVLAEFSTKFKVDPKSHNREKNIMFLAAKLMAEINLGPGEEWSFTHEHRREHAFEAVT